ncbi:MAG: hypothetical protein R3249_09655 [Nitriliruptorales bacterium]|nr:hypothetical protein [Nitriliruptorales bacterium]
MRARAATYFTSRVAPRAVEAIQTLAGAALLTALCLVVARMVVPDLVYRGLTSQLASPVSIVGLLLLTVATILLERELRWHGLTAGEAIGAGGGDADASVVIVAGPSVPVTAPVAISAAQPAAPSAEEPVIRLPESETVVTITEPSEPVVRLPDSPVLQLVGHADPPEPRAEPIEDDPWWMPWMDRGRQSVFDGASQGPRSEHRSDELIPAA